MAHQNQEIQYTKHFINNQFVDSKSGKTYQDYNPATGRAQAQIADGDQQDVSYAVDSAKHAFYSSTSKWQQMDASQRGYLLNHFANLMERNVETFANLETLDQGKPFQQAKDDVYLAIRTFRYYAGYADKMHGMTIPSDGDNMSYTRQEPYGLVGLILASSNPILMFAWTVAPALAAGNTLIIKPSKKTPLTALYAAYLSKQAGFPDGVLNIVCGDGQTVGQAIVQHPSIRKITFSGNTRNGQVVMEQTAKYQFKQLTMNLSSNNPLVIFNDFNLDEAARIAHEALFRNQGQNSSAAHRIYVQDNIYDEMVKRLTDLARKRKVGSPFEQSTQHGPQVDEEIMNRILAFIETTRKDGAQLQYGGKRYGSQGYFIEPTVFSNCTDSMRCANDDLYGPVQYIFRFKSYDEIVSRLNQNKYGLAAGVLTHNVQFAINFAKDLEYGNVWINDYQDVTPQTPYGGYKQSGWDSELGYRGLYLYLQPKTCCFNTNQSNDSQYQYQYFLRKY